MPEIDLEIETELLRRMYREKPVPPPVLENVRLAKALTLMLSSHPLQEETLAAIAVLTPPGAAEEPESGDAPADKPKPGKKSPKPAES